MKDKNKKFQESCLVNNTSLKGKVMFSKNNEK